MSENLFIFGRPVSEENFYNRKEEIETAFGFLKKLQCFSIVGERRIGKTSFLNYILSKKTLEKRGIDPKKYIIAYINVGGLHKITKEGLIQIIVKKIIEQTQIDLKSKNVFEKLKECVKKSALDSKYLVIALDEFEAIKSILDEDFSHWLRFIFQNSNVMAITVSQTTIGGLEKIREVSPLFNIFGNLFLKPFSREETENMIKKIFQGGKIQVEDEEVTFLSDLSGGNPYLIQLMGYYYYEKRKKKKEINHEKFQKNMLLHATDQFEGYWNHLEKNERKCLLHSTYENERVCYILERKGYLIKENQEWKISSKLFEKFLDAKKKEIIDKGREDEEEKYPFAKVMAISALIITVLLSLSMFVSFLENMISFTFIAILIILIFILFIYVPYSYAWRR